VNAAIAALVAMAVERDRRVRAIDEAWSVEDMPSGAATTACPRCGGSVAVLERIDDRARFLGPCATCEVGPTPSATTEPPAPPPPAGGSWASRVARALMAELDDDFAVKEVAKAVAGMVRAGKLDFLAWAERADEMTRANHAAVAKAAEVVNPC
jgi:hypothetical protein